MTVRGTLGGIVALCIALGSVAAHAATWEVAEGAVSGRYPGYWARYYGLPSMVLMGTVSMLIASSLVGMPARFNKYILGIAVVMALVALGFQVASFFAFGTQQATLTLENVTVEGVGRLKGSHSQTVGFQTRAGWGLYLSAALTAMCVVLTLLRFRLTQPTPNPYMDTKIKARTPDFPT